MVQTEKNQYIWLVTHKPSVVHSVCKGGRESFFLLKPPVNTPPSDAHIKHWYKNGSGLNTQQCFLMC